MHKSMHFEKNCGLQHVVGTEMGLSPSSVHLPGLSKCSPLVPFPYLSVALLLPPLLPYAHTFWWHEAFGSNLPSGAEEGKEALRGNWGQEPPLTPTNGTEQLGPALGASSRCECQ